MRLSILLLAAASAATSAPGKKIFGWGIWQQAEETAAQLLNPNWEGLVDSVQVQCGVHLNKDGLITVNSTEYDACKPIFDAMEGKGIEAWIMEVPQVALDNPTATYDSAVSVLQDYPVFTGFSFDDERDCAPRAVFSLFEEWMQFMNGFSDAVHEYNQNFTVTNAVQAMFGIEDVEYDPNAVQPCDNAPWDYEIDPRIGQMMATSSVDWWLVMDTYYFSTARYLNALDYYMDNVGIPKTSIAVMNRDDLSGDDYASRFHALQRSGAQQFSMFLMPMDDAWLTWLRRWKYNCSTCDMKGSLGCFEPSVVC